MHVIKTIEELTDQELEQLNIASKREFKVTLPSREDLAGRYFFLLKAKGQILAMGQLLPIEPIILGNEKFSIFGIGGIIANEKGKGYGSQIMTVIKDKLTSLKQTGVGFCKLKNKGFYEKCGFATDIPSLRRFIHHTQGEKNIPNQADEENECIFYQDGTDKFMEKVLKNSSTEVNLPIPPVW